MAPAAGPDRQPFSKRAVQRILNRTPEESALLTYSLRTGPGKSSHVFLFNNLINCLI